MAAPIVLCGRFMRQKSQEDPFGFIRPQTTLPDEFKNGNVYFRSESVRGRQPGVELTNQQAWFVLRPGSEEKPRANTVWLVEPSSEEVIASNSMSRPYREQNVSRPQPKRLPKPTHEPQTVENVIAKIFRQPSHGRQRPNTDSDQCITDITEPTMEDMDESSEEDDEDEIDTKTASEQVTEEIKREIIREPARQYSGVVRTVKDDHGYIRPLQPLSEKYNQEKDVVFNTNYVFTGFLQPRYRDVMDFTLRALSYDRPVAYNTRLAEATQRSGSEWVTYMSELLKILKITSENQEEEFEFTDSVLLITEPPSLTQLLTSILGCLPVWVAIGKCKNLGNEGIMYLIDFLLQLSKRSSALEESFRRVLDVILSSPIMSSRSGYFEGFVRSIATDHDSNHQFIDKIEEFALLVIQHKADMAKVVIKGLYPLVSESSCDSCRFQYKLLLAAARLTPSHIDNMDWDELPLVPSVSELLDGPLEASINMQPVKEKGPYSSAAEYADTYFRLLRADCFGALKKGLRDFLSGKLDHRDMNVYQGICITGVIFTRDEKGLALVMKIPEGMLKELKQSSKLMFGNLICITLTGKFDDLIWATVSNRDLLLKDRLIVVELCSDSNKLSDADVIRYLHAAGSATLVIESPTYYKAYQPVMKALQSMDPDKIPFQDELVGCNPTVQPTFILPHTLVDSSLVFSGLSSGSHTSIESFCNNTSTTSLDPSQLLALQDAILNRVAIIQGPPGTGKTFVGVKLVNLLLSLSTRPQSPILVLTYKNHALDEFLKDISTITKKIVRVGGRSQDKLLDKYSLQELRKECKMDKTLFGQYRDAISQIEDLKGELKNALGNVYKSKVWHDTDLLDHLQRHHIESLLLGCNWKSEKITINEVNDKGWKRKVKVDRQYVKFILTPDSDSILKKQNILGILVKTALKQWMPKEHSYICIEQEYLPSVSSMSETGGAGSEEEAPEKDFEEIEKERLAGVMAKEKEKDMKNEMWEFDESTKSKTIPRFLPQMKKQVESVTMSSMFAIGDLWELNIRQRLLIIQQILFSNMQEAGKNLEDILVEYQQACRVKHQLEEQHRIEILRDQEVIGMTITGASIYHHYLKYVHPAIVIVEEAAEVLESHLLAVLGPWTQQLIMIGDHKQLRPTVEHFSLVKNFNFDLSMMERLIKNNLQFSALAMQNRMRPEFADLLLDIYPKLQSNIPRVSLNLEPNCVSKTMFFWAHAVLEKKTRSCTNEEEAKRAVQLALFLIQNGAPPESITIIGAYLGQVRMIRKMVKEARESNSHIFAMYDDPVSNTAAATSKSTGPHTKDTTTERNIVVYTIDMYQGDENDFVIVSLTRSNAKGELGFLRILNRRCVAQSRARRGLFFLGNATMLQQHNRNWDRLIKKMSERDCVGPAIPLHCPNHPHATRIHAVTADDIPLNNYCLLECMTKMPCLTHKCPKKCQPSHRHDKCCFKIEFIYKQCGHSGVRHCYEDETKKVCDKEMPMVFKVCGHPGTRRCYEEEEGKNCFKACTKVLACKHPCGLRCYEECNPKECKLCKEKREMELLKKIQAQKKLLETIRNDTARELRELQTKGKDLKYNLEELFPHGDTAAEYFNISDMTQKHVQPGHCWYPKVTKIIKVTNEKLLVGWLRTRLSLHDPSRTGLKFHGTSVEGAEKIVEEGFKMPDPTKYNMFGVGIYFASESSKSAQEMYTKGSNRLLLCDILLGKTMTVQKAMEKMDARTLSSEGFDSLYAKRGSKETGGVYNDEYVVYDSHQALPKYVVHYTKMFNPQKTTASTISALERDAIQKKKMVSYNIKPTREVRVDDPLETHFRIAEAQFLRLRGQLNCKITSVDYHINPELVAKFRSKAAEFSDKHGTTSERAKQILAFHGTPNVAAIDAIVKDNFRVDLLSKNTGDKGYYGAGIYFTEFPAVGIGYAGHNRLLLCMLLPGKTYDCPGLMMGAPLQPGFDSHRAHKDSEGRGQELVIYNPAQILPCYVIQHQ